MSSSAANSSLPFRVIIAGGSIAGLSLALMLDTIGVDWVILERNEVLLRQVGAGLAILGNGMRILDQLSCCEEILRKAQVFMNEFQSRSPEGKLLASASGVSRHLIARFGIADT